MERMSASATPLRPTRTLSRERLLWPYVALLASAALLAAMLGGTASIGDAPLLFAVLVATLLILDSLDADLLGGGHVSPTTLPAVALALIFGPAGAVAGEAALSVKRAILRRPLVKNVFDFGCQGLSGVAAWAAAQPFGGEGTGLLLAGLAAGVAYYVVNSVLLSTVWTLAEGRGPLGLFRERLLHTLPHEVAAGPIAALLIYAEARLGAIAIALVGVPAAALWAGQMQSLSTARKSLADAEEANQRLRRMMLTTVESLARTIEARDPYTGGHTERVAEFAQRIAVRLGFDEEGLRGVAVGAVIHDIGKIGIPDAVLLKPGALDDDEWAEMRRHPEIGSYILDELEIPAYAKAMARHHHERFDGGGYPDGLAGEEIPLSARVLTVADALDAMTTDRPYRDALAMEVALAEVREKSGTQFCPRVVAAALDVISAETP
jgi:hypothetical protein